MSSYTGRIELFFGHLATLKEYAEIVFINDVALNEDEDCDRASRLTEYVEIGDEYLLVFPVQFIEFTVGVFVVLVEDRQVILHAITGEIAQQAYAVGDVIENKPAKVRHKKLATDAQRRHIKKRAGVAHVIFKKSFL